MERKECGRKLLLFSLKNWTKLNDINWSFCSTGHRLRAQTTHMMTKAREKRETQTKVIWGVGGWNPYNGDGGEGLRRPWLNSWRNCVHCRGWNPRCKGRLHKHSGETLLQAAIKTKPFWQILNILCDWKRNRFILVEAYLWYQLTLHSRREVNVPESEIDGKTNPCDT